MAIASSIFQEYVVAQIDQGNTAFYPATLLALNKEKKGHDFLVPLNYYESVLATLDPVSLVYAPEQIKKKLQHELNVTRLLLCAQQQYELHAQKTENDSRYEQKINQCNEFLSILGGSHPQLQPASKTCCSYLGMGIAQEVIKLLVQRKSKSIKEALAALNEKRLYWIWGSVFVKTVLSVIPDDFYNSQTAAQRIKAPDPYTGCLSWTLYYFRYALNFFLLLKHSIPGPWMHDEERQIPWVLRFRYQWQQRKFALLNDLLWGTANVACFFWLTGKGALGAWGDVLTILLLIFDVIIALWDYQEQLSLYKKQMKQYQADIEEYERLLKNSQGERSYYLQLQLNALQKAQLACQADWEMQKLHLYNNMGYAVGLMLAFVVLTVPFFPISATASFTLGIVGAVLCFAMTVITNAIRGGIEIHKTSVAWSNAESTQKQYYDTLISQLRCNPDLNHSDNKWYYLEYKKSIAETAYQKKMVLYQKIHLIRSIIMEAFIPAAILGCLVFFPFGIGLAAIAAALACAVASHFILNALFLPDEALKALPPFDENEYLNCCNIILYPQDICYEKNKNITLFAPASPEPKEKYDDSNPKVLPIVNPK